MADEEIGESQLGETAQRQIEAARHDPRRDRARSAPTADFFDAVEEVVRVRLSMRLGARALAASTVEGEDHAARQEAWERRALGQAEIDGDFGWLNASTLTSLHGALDALVEDVGLITDRVTARLITDQVMAKVAREQPELADVLTKEQLCAVADAAVEFVLERRTYRKPRMNGPLRWESALEPAGLALPENRPIPADLGRVLTEACVLRDVLVHRAGRVDQKAADACPTLGFAVDEFVRLRTPRTLELAAALIAYGTDVAQRSLNRFCIGEPAEFDRWRDCAPAF